MPLSSQLPLDTIDQFLCNPSKPNFILTFLGAYKVIAYYKLRLIVLMGLDLFYTCRSSIYGPPAKVWGINRNNN